MTKHPSYGDLILNDLENVVFVSGEKISLSGAEFRILAALLENKDEVINKYRLEDIAWEGRGASESAITVAITNIRKKIKDSICVEIITVPRKGYLATVKETQKEILTTSFREEENEFSSKSKCNFENSKHSKRPLYFFWDIVVLVFGVFSLLLFMVNRLVYSYEEIRCYGEKPVVCLTPEARTIGFESYYSDIGDNKVIFISKDSHRVEFME